jgi:hypothetical protein
MLLCAPAGFAADPASRTAHPATSQRPPNKVASNEFAVMDWLSLTPAANSLIRTPNQAASVDLTARDDETFITVYARKKKFQDTGPRPVTGYAPGTDAGATPDYAHVRYLPPTHCANGGYSTVGGQSANGQDLIGFLGSGTDC